MNQSSLKIAALALALGVTTVVLLRSDRNGLAEGLPAGSAGDRTPKKLPSSRSNLELTAVAPTQPGRAQQAEATNSASPEATEATTAAPETSGEAVDPRDERWRAKYRGMSADQLEAENERISILYTTEMSIITWPRFQSNDCSYADPTKGERPPPSKPGALVAIAGQKGGRVPYVVVTEDEAPVLHEWMSELAWLLAETERRRAEDQDG